MQIDMNSLENEYDTQRHAIARTVRSQHLLSSLAQKSVVGGQVCLIYAVNVSFALPKLDRLPHQPLFFLEDSLDYKSLWSHFMAYVHVITRHTDAVASDLLPLCSHSIHPEACRSLEKITSPLILLCKMKEEFRQPDCSNRFEAFRQHMMYF